MADLKRHPSLRFSVFELAADIGLETTALDGNFDPILEEDEREPSSADRQRQTHSSDELADSPFPLTPPGSNDALFTTQPLTLGQKRQEDRPRFIERFPSPSPELVSTTPTPRTPPAKLRKAHTPTAGTPISEPLRLDYNTDGERDRPKRKENGKKKERDDEREKQRQIQTDVDEEKKLLGGLLRFRTRSKERKTAAKQAVQAVPLPPPPPETMPVKPHTPPPLPIAERFVRPKDEISFRPKPRESGSSHGGSTSVGHGSATSHAESSDAHEPYIRPRDRSSRYERPHPAWRTAPSTLGNIGLGSARGAIVDAPLPKEIHAYPPGQSIFDREPVKPNARRNNSTDSEQGKTPAVDMDMVNRYYGITPAETQTSPTVPSVPSPQSRFALAQALSPIETKPALNEGALRPSPAPTTPLPASPSPYIVPSPNPGQTEFGAQPRAKRGRMNLPPPMDPALVPPKRLMGMGAFNPPPTPPPTTELPPIPTDVSIPARTGLQRPLGSPQPMLLPPSAAGGLRPGPPTSPLGMRSSSPSLRPEPSRLSPYPERPGTALQEGGPPARAASPMLRGRAPAFPTRPITPTRAPPAQQQQQQQYRPVSPPRVQPASRPGFSPNPSSGPGSGFLVNRRPEYDVRALNRNRTASLDENEGGPTRPVVGQRQPTYPSRTDVFSTQQQQEPSYGSRTTPPPTRKRSVRKTAANQSGYDSDDSRYSRHSRDTYYGRDTVYYDDQNMPPLPGSNVPPLPQRNFTNMEQERQAGRERLVRMLASREI